MSKFFDQLTTIDSSYVKSQSGYDQIVSDPLLDQELAAAVRHSATEHEFELKKLLRRKIPLLFLIEFLGAPEKSTTLPTRQHIAQRWLKPYENREQYTSGYKDRIFYILLLFFVVSLTVAIVFNMLVESLFGMWSVIGLLTIAVFTLIADGTSWWNLRFATANLSPKLTTVGNALSEKARLLLAQEEPRRALSHVEPSQAHLLTHWSASELRSILSARGEVRKRMLVSVAPTFSQVQRMWATRCSYPLYLMHMLGEVFPSAWKFSVKKLHHQMP